MWRNYLIITSVGEIQFGMKYNEEREVCIVGGQKRYSEVMFRFIENIFSVGQEDIHSAFPQTYKIRLSFNCNRKILKKAIGASKTQDSFQQFQFIEAKTLGRIMR